MSQKLQQSLVKYFHVDLFLKFQLIANGRNGMRVNAPKNVEEGWEPIREQWSKRLKMVEWNVQDIQMLQNFAIRKIVLVIFNFAFDSNLIRCHLSSSAIHFWAFKLRLKFSLVDCEWGEWKIGECSVECGTGTRLNLREPKVLAAHGGKECSGLANATEICNIQECPGFFQISWPNWITW